MERKKEEKEREKYHKEGENGLREGNEQWTTVVKGKERGRKENEARQPLGVAQEGAAKPTLEGKRRNQISLKRLLTW